ncbi:MAG: diguanylate cyclase [Gammaproteobacteria bacterium]|nr:diguanylate cyclase [Gammaproteobacteria bacterium]
MSVPSQNSEEEQEVVSLPSLRNKHSNPVVLLVDDQPIIAEGVRRLLGDHDDIEFHYCQDPKQAIDMAQRVRPTVILQDMVMPDMDGIMLVKFFCGHPQTRNIPIIVLSSNEDSHDKSRAFSSGAIDYLVKLPDQIELVARIRAHSRGYLSLLERDEAYRELRKLKHDLERSNAQLKHLSSIDGLTGVANRRYFDERLAEETQRGLRERTSLAVVLLDIDYFKPYNDNYGHQMGDTCLREVAQALSHSLRRPSDFIARYGGEEFVAILPATNMEGARIVAETLCSAIDVLELTHEHSKMSDHITVSVGYAALVPLSMEDGTLLVSASDQGLYDAKRAGKNRVMEGKI